MLKTNTNIKYPFLIKAIVSPMTQQSINSKIDIDYCTHYPPIYPFKTGKRNIYLVQL